MKQTESLARSGLFTRVLICGEGRVESPPLPAIEVLDSQRELWRLTTVWSHRLPNGWVTFGLLKRAERLLRRLWHYRRGGISVVTAHSLTELGLGVLFKYLFAARLVYDAHELETETNGLEGRAQRSARRMERRLITHCDAVTCVSESIARWYAREYGIEQPALVRNIPDLRGQPAPLPSGVLRDRFRIPPADLLFIYQGGLFRGRRVEQILRVFEHVRPGRHVVFMGYGELEGLVRSAAERLPNVHFMPAVPPGDVARHTADADVGLTGVQNTCLSYYLSLPNKLFEYLSCGLGLLVPDYPEMRQLVEQHRCGWTVGESDEAWRARIDELGSAAIARAKAAARNAALAYSWQEEERVLLHVYHRLVGQDRRVDHII